MPEAKSCLVDQGGPQAPAGGVERHPGAGDAPADHQDVELLSAQAPQGALPVEGSPLGTGSGGASGRRAWRRGRSGPRAPSVIGPACHSRPGPRADGPRSRADGRHFDNRLSRNNRLVIWSAPCRSPDELTERVPAPGPQGHGPAPVHLPGPRRATSTHPTAEAVYDVGPGRDGDHLAQDRVPDPERAGRAGRDRRAGSRARARPVSTPTWTRSTTIWCAVAAARCATSTSTSAASPCRRAPTRVSRSARPRWCSGACASECRRRRRSDRRRQRRGVVRSPEPASPATIRRPRATVISRPQTPRGGRQAQCPH